MLARQAAPQFGLHAREADAVIDAVADTVQRFAQSTLQACGADDALARRVGEFLARQRTRIAGNN